MTKLTQSEWISGLAQKFPAHFCQLGLEEEVAGAGTAPLPPGA